MRNQRKVTTIVASFLACLCTIFGTAKISTTEVNAEGTTVSTTSLVTAGENPL